MDSVQASHPAAPGSNSPSVIPRNSFLMLSRGSLTEFYLEQTRGGTSLIFLGPGLLRALKIRLDRARAWRFELASLRTSL